MKTCDFSKARPGDRCFYWYGPNPDEHGQNATIKEVVANIVYFKPDNLPKGYPAHIDGKSIGGISPSLFWKCPPLTDCGEPPKRKETVEVIIRGGYKSGKSTIVDLLMIQLARNGIEAELDEQERKDFDTAMRTLTFPKRSERCKDTVKVLVKVEQTQKFPSSSISE